MLGIAGSYRDFVDFVFWIDFDVGKGFVMFWSRFMVDRTSLINGMEQRSIIAA